MAPGSEPAAQRVFVALWPPDDVRDKLARVVQDVAAQFPAARAMQTRNLHLTLAFVGSLAATRVPEVADAIASVPVAPFDWRMDRIGAFARARVVWAGGDASEPLSDLARRIRALLDRLQVRYDPKPFAAHVTLLRDVAQVPMDPTSIALPIDWHVTRATLVQSVPGEGGPVYRPLLPRSPI